MYERYALRSYGKRNTASKKRTGQRVPGSEHGSEISDLPLLDLVACRRALYSLRRLRHRYYYVARRLSTLAPAGWSTDRNPDASQFSSWLDRQVTLYNAGSDFESSHMRAGL